MDASEIQRATLQVLKKLRCQVQPGTPYSLSEVAADPDFRAQYPNSFIVAFLATVDEYQVFQRQTNDAGLWVASHTFTPVQGMDRQMHDVLMVEYRADRSRRRSWWQR